MSADPGSFERVSPVSAGVASVGITAFIKALDRSKAAMRGFVFLRGGKAVFERYWEPYTAEDKNWVYSLSKSFTSTAVGFCFDDGLLSPDTLALSFFPEIDSTSCSENARKMRLRDLLSMTSGHAEDPTVKLMLSPPENWEKLFFSLPIEYEPGTYFVYNTAASYILSSIVTRVTKTKTLDLLKERLFEPLRFHGVAGDCTPSGMFDGKRILSEQWVLLASGIQSDNGAKHRVNEAVDWRQGYGFQFWRCQHNAFRGDGAAGQYCIVMPDYDAVLALMSETPDMQEVLDIVWSCLLPAMNNMSSPREKALCGASICLDRSADAKEASLFFTDNGLLFTMRDDGESFTLESGRGFYKDCLCTLPIGETVFTPCYTLTPEKRVSSYFQWTDPDTLEINWVYRETPHRERLVCRFNEDTVSFTLHSSVQGKKDEDDVDFTGKIVFQ